MISSIRFIATLTVLLSLIPLSFSVAQEETSDIRFAPGPLNEIFYPDDLWGGEYSTLEEIKPVYLDKDFQVDIPPPPANDSPATLLELKRLLKFAAEERTPEMVGEIKRNQFGTNKQNFFMGAYVPFVVLNEIDMVKLAGFQEMTGFLYGLKRKYKRARPTQLAPDLSLVIPIPGSGSYPSGNSSSARMAARIYSYIDPANEDAYLKHAKEIDMLREVAGIHYKSDCEAGSNLADQVFDELLTIPEYRSKLDQAKESFQKFLNERNTIISNDTRFTDDMLSEEAKTSLPPRYLSADTKFEVKPPYANNSVETSAELSLLKEYQFERTADDVLKIEAEAFDWPGLDLSPSVAVDENVRNEVAELIISTIVELEYFLYQEKLRFARPRPTQLSLELKPAIKVPGHPAYPSGHGGESAIAAMVLGYIDPVRKKQYRKSASDIGHRREIAGLHYPSDTKAGVDLAEQVFQKLLTVEAYKTQIDKVAAAVKESQARKSSE